MVDFNKIGSDAASVEDLTKDKAFERELPREGVAMIRYIGYIETGKHLPTNPAHKAALKCIHIIELNHQDHLIELEGGEKVPTRLFIHQNKGITAASGYRKLFNVMNKACDKRFNHFVQMLGSGFLGEIFHNTYKEKTYANLHLDNAWSFRKPVMTDVLTNRVTPVPIPEPKGDILGFLWENDAISDADVVTMWNSLYIEGEKEDGSSKNWVQLQIMDNIDWEGSRTQALTQEFVGLEEEEITLPAADGSLAGLAGMAEGEVEDVPF